MRVHTYIHMYIHIHIEMGYMLGIKAPHESGGPSTEMGCSQNEGPFLGIYYIHDT